VQCLLSHRWSWKGASRRSKAHTLSWTPSLMMVVTQRSHPLVLGSGRWCKTCICTRNAYRKIRRRRRFLATYDVRQEGPFFLLPLLHGGGLERMAGQSGALTDVSWVGGDEGELFRRRMFCIGMDATRVSGTYGMLPRKQMYVGRVHVANVNSSKRRDRSPCPGWNPGGAYNMDS
ncbi:hypothetical protein EDD15DRAFT_2227285, partial [Pisolithus albus]